MADAIATLPVDVVANIDDLQAGMEAAARQVQSSVASMNRAVATVGRTGDALGVVEGSVKRVGRAFSDARGALELFGTGGAQVSAALAPLAGAVGGVADAVGSIATLARGGAAGLGLSAIVPVLGAIVTAATAAYAAYRYFAASTEQVAGAQMKLDEAMRLAEDRLTTAEQKSRALAEAKRQEALERLRNAEAIQAETVALLQADITQQRLVITETARQAETPGRRGTLRQSTARQAAGTAVEDLAALERQAGTAGEALARTQRAVQALLNPSADERARAAAGGSAVAQAGALEAALNRLATEAGQLRIPTDQLRDAQQLLEATRTPAEAYAAKLERLNELLASGAIGQETWNRAVTQAQGTLNSTANQAESFAKAYTGYGDSIATAFGDAIFKGRRLMDVVNNLGQALAQQIFRQTVGNQLSSAVSNLIGGAVGSMFGTGLTPMPGKVTVPNLPKAFAGGGRPPLGVASIVGESGPEWFVPDRAGTILPHGVAPAVGGLTYAPAITINAPHARLSAGEMRAIVVSAVEQSVARVADVARRGGRAARDIRGR